MVDENKEQQAGASKQTDEKMPKSPEKPRAPDTQDDGNAVVQLRDRVAKKRPQMLTEYIELFLLDFMEDLEHKEKSLEGDDDALALLQETRERLELDKVEMLQALKKDGQSLDIAKLEAIRNRRKKELEAQIDELCPEKQSQKRANLEAVQAFILQQEEIFIQGMIRMRSKIGTEHMTMYRNALRGEDFEKALAQEIKRSRTVLSEPTYVSYRVGYRIASALGDIAKRTFQTSFHETENRKIEWYGGTEGKPLRAEVALGRAANASEREQAMLQVANAMLDAGVDDFFPTSSKTRGLSGPRGGISKAVSDWFADRKMFAGFSGISDENWECDQMKKWIKHFGLKGHGGRLEVKAFRNHLKEKGKTNLLESFDKFVENEIKQHRAEVKLAADKLDQQVQNNSSGLNISGTA